MLKHSRIKSFVTEAREILSGARRRARKKLEAEVRDHKQIRLQNCAEFLAKLSSQINKLQMPHKQIVAEDLTELLNEQHLLQQMKKISLHEFDKRLEIILLKGRTVHILSECGLSLSQETYSNAEKTTIRQLLEDANELHNTKLEYQTLTSHILVDYRSKLENLEQKAQAQFHNKVN